MKKQITYKELIELNNLINKYLLKNRYTTPYISPNIPGGYTDKVATNLVTNMKNIIKQSKKHFEEYNDLVDNLQRNNAAFDEKTKVLLPMNSDGSRQYTIEGEIKLKKELKELMKESIELHIRIAEGEWDLDEDEKESFNGILISEFKVKE